MAGMARFNLVSTPPLMRSIRLGLLALLAIGSLAAPAAQRPNVLLLVSDDLAATLGCYGHPNARTPNLDRLAHRGVRFDRAYCQFPHCNPSRASMLSGLRPHSTRVTDNADNLYTNVPGVVTLPALFRRHGYATARCGKIFHLGVPAGNESMDDPQAWDFGTPFRDERPYPPHRPSPVKVKTGKQQGLPWQECLCADNDLVDGDFARNAIEWLERRDPAKPFFLAVGFHRPHLPFVAPAPYFDLYPFDQIQLPAEPADDEADIPQPARNGAVASYAMTATPDQRRAAIRAYLATVSYMDAQAGRVLDALDRLGVAGNTIILFTGDHGWHLGEHGLWHKRSLFEECARVPFIVFAPGARGNGRSSLSLVEMLDVYPTLCDLAGVPPPAALQGRSLRPLLDDSAAAIHDAAFTQARRGPGGANWGRSVRTPRWRCTEWDEGRNGIELYDHEADSGEHTNLASDPRHAGVLKELRALLAERLPPILAASPVQPQPADISQIDTNFAAVKVGDLEVIYSNALDVPFAVEGFPWRRAADAPLYRLPEVFTSKEINPGALNLARHTSGGAVRFRTDSPYILLRAELAHSLDMNHMPRTASAGFDLYRGIGPHAVFVAAAQPGRDQKVWERLLARSDGSMADWTLNMPLYGGASRIEIGVAPGSRILPPRPHAIAKPILFYGSSITQGGCASRPGNAYTSLLCREVDAAQINLGFSGSGRGEIAVAEAIGRLDLACFVMDYDHNAPDVEHLRSTHRAFFDAVRKRQPDLPILLLSKCDFKPGDAARRDVIRDTFEQAVRGGDQKVWFIDGETLFGNEHPDACTVDGTHPNDLGFYRMARAILPVLSKALQSD